MICTLRNTYCVTLNFVRRIVAILHVRSCDCAQLMLRHVHLRRLEAFEKVSIGAERTGGGGQVMSV